jgi:hypothetical protein
MRFPRLFVNPRMRPKGNDMQQYVLPAAGVILLAATRLAEAVKSGFRHVAV